jgi:hypothetical protein
VAIAVLAVSLTTILALLSKGLGEVAARKSRLVAMEILARSESAVRAQKRSPGSDTFVFATWFSGVGRPPVDWRTGDSPEAGEILFGPSGEVVPDASSEARFRMRYELQPSVGVPARVRVLLRVAWPASARWDNGWSGGEGRVESVVIAVPADA